MVVRSFALIVVSCMVACLSAQEDSPFTILALDLPEGLQLEPGGMAVRKDGSLAVATRKGEIWIIENPAAAPGEKLRLRRFASGLHEPLGLTSVGEKLYVVQRSELTEIQDEDGDGLADSYLSFAKGWGVSGNYHEYAYGPVRDKNGDLWLTLNATIGKRGVHGDAWRGWGMRASSDGVLHPVCAGMRSPAGLGTNRMGDVFYTDQQGNWIPTCTLSHMETGDFFGHTDSLRSVGRAGSPLDRELGKSIKIPSGKTVAELPDLLPSYKLPAIWFPYDKAGRSATDVLVDSTKGAFGPFEDQLFVGEFTNSEITRVFLERVDGTYQGACFPFLKGFQCGVFRLAFGNDASLYVGQTNRGWNSVGPRSFGIERVVWNKRVPFELLEMRAQPDGFELEFTRAIDAQAAAQVASYRMLSYTYKYHSTYGSPEVDERELVVKFAKLLNERTVHLGVAGLRARYVHELHLNGVRSKDGRPLWHPRAFYTLNKIPTAKKRQ